MISHQFSHQKFEFINIYFFLIIVFTQKVAFIKYIFTIIYV